MFGIKKYLLHSDACEPCQGNYCPVLYCLYSRLGTDLFICPILLLNIISTNRWFNEILFECQTFSFKWESGSIESNTWLLGLTFTRNDDSSWSSHLGIHKQTNACWSLPRHFKIWRTWELRSLFYGPLLLFYKWSNVLIGGDT